RSSRVVVVRSAWYVPPAGAPPSGPLRVPSHEPLRGRGPATVYEYRETVRGWAIVPCAHTAQIVAPLSRTTTPTPAPLQIPVSSAASPAIGVGVVVKTHAPS